MARPTYHVSSSLTHHRPQTHLPAAEWRCRRCGKLLGVHRGGKLQMRFKDHEYLVSLPVEATCRGCGTHNRT